MDTHKEPLFFDAHKGDLYPSVYALWLLPSFLPTFEIHPDTFHFIQSGAGMASIFRKCSLILFSDMLTFIDLMLPGIIPPQEGFANFLAGEKYTVTIKGSPYVPIL